MLVPEHLARDPKINAQLQLVPECISQNMPNNSLNIVPESLEKPKISLDFSNIIPKISKKTTTQMEYHGNSQNTSW